MTLTVEPTEVTEGVPDTQDLFREARRRRRRRWAVAGVTVIVAAIGGLAWWLSAGAAPGQPPTTPLPPVASPPAHMPPLPANATPLQTRSIQGYTLHIYAWPTELPFVPVETDWVLVAPHSASIQASQIKMGPSAGGGPGIVHQGGASGGTATGPPQAVHDYQVTSPSISTIQVVDGKKVLDSMAPATFNGVRFAVLAVLDGSPLQSLKVQGLDAAGNVVYSAPF